MTEAQTPSHNRLRRGQFTLAALVVWVVLAAAICFMIRNRVVLPSISFSVVGSLLVAIGSWGICTNRPYLLSYHWLRFICAIGYAPMIANMLESSFRLPGAAAVSFADLVMQWLFPIGLLGYIGFVLLRVKDGVFVGVTGATLEQSLLAALKKLDLRYEDYRSVLRLPSVGAELELSIGFWSQSSNLTVKQSKFAPILEDIAAAMKDYYGSPDVEPLVVRYLLIVSGVGPAAFRDGVLAALKKLGIPYHETRSVIRLPSIGAFVKPSVAAWRGVGRVEISEREFAGKLLPMNYLGIGAGAGSGKQRELATILDSITREMRESFRAAAVGWNKITSLFHILFGAIMIAVAVLFLRT